MAAPGGKVCDELNSLDGRDMPGAPVHVSREGTSGLMTELARYEQIVTSAGAGSSVLADVLLAQMLRTAADELARHARNGGQCVSCGQNWPCARARQADLALAGW